MSQENVELCRAAYERWNSEDFAGFLALISPEVEWEERFNPEAGIYRGPDAAQEWMRVSSGAFEKRPL